MEIQMKFLAYFFVIVSSYSVKGDGESSESKNCFARDVIDFWERQDAEFLLAPQKDIVLTLGLSGSGKTETTLFLTGANLRAVVKRNATVIIDENDEIDNKMTMPNLMTDPEENVAFYDWTGFENSLEPKYEITNAYFLNKLFNYANGLKFVFIIDHKEFDKTVIKLLEQAFKRIPNIKKFKDGIGMVVTNVDIFKSQEIDIAKKLENIRISLEKKSDPKKSKLNAEMINYINILLTQDKVQHKKGDTVYKRIGLLPAPKVGGKLNEMNLYKEAKVKLKKLIHKNLKYVPKMNTTFGLALSAESKNKISDTLDFLMEVCTLNFDKILHSIRRHFLHVERDVHDLISLKASLENGHNELSKMDVNQILPKMHTDIIRLANRLNVDMNPKFLKLASKTFVYVNFLFKFSIKKWKVNEKVANELKTAVKELENSRKWYAFLIDLTNELGRDNFQNTNDKNSALKFCGKLPKKEEVKISELGLSELFNKFNQNNNSYILNDAQRTINMHELRALKDVLADAYDNKLKIAWSANDTKLTVNGNNFRISDIIREAKCWNEATVIDIIALNTLILDKSIQKVGQKARITIIAPRWEFLENFQINLDGKAGQDDFSHAEEGKAGKPGSPGGSGGSLVGFGLELIKPIDDNTLTFLADGGNGGKGQDGGPGNTKIL